MSSQEGLSDSPAVCPRCGATLSAADPEGLCPRCLLDPALGREVAPRHAGATLDQPSPSSEGAGLPDHRLIGAHPPEGPGSHVGRYRLMELIGEGGFGAVFLAEQERPVRRKVALKVIKLGMDTREVVARFEAERQALALMDHPNIAKVFDGGTTHAGRPFFVMELVRGVPITAYCDEHKLSTRDRLGLFAQVCRAVQHAHQKGVIHRDLKPSNVLVAAQDDGAPLPKVIDFGIAKATGGRLTEKTVYTELRQFIGTPEYMSPEQAGLGGLDVDTRSDVYSLGVLLYELLTGTTPFDGRDLRSKAYGEIQRIIREVEPPRPSTRVGTMAGETLGIVAARRGTEPRKLGRLLHGELDWIVMRCLEKDRARRYETANGIAADVERYLKGEPVSAGPPSAAYRLRKFARRHRLSLAAAAAVAAGLALALAGVAYAAVREGAQRQRHITALQAEQARTVEQKQRAERARAEAEAVNQFLAEMLQAADPFAFPSAGGGGAADVTAAVSAGRTVRQVLDQAAARLDRRALGGEPRVEAAVRTSLGRAYLGLGLYPQAEAQFRAALDLRTAPAGGGGGGGGGGGDAQAAASWNDLGLALRARADFAGAERAHAKALEIHRRRRDEGADAGGSWANLGVALAAQGKEAQAEPAMREGLRIRRKVLGDEHLQVADSWDYLGVLLGFRGDKRGAEEALRESLRVRLKRLGPDHALVGESWDHLGNLLGAAGRHRDAEAASREGLRVRLKALGEVHPRVASSWNNLGSLLLDGGDYEAAASAFREALRVARLSLGEDHRTVSSIQENLVMALRARGAPAAREGAEADLPRAEQGLAARPGDAGMLAARAEALARLGRFRSALGDYDRAVEADPSHAIWWCQRACLRLYLGDVRGYREESGQLVARFGDTRDADVADRVAMTCLLDPDPPIDPAVLARLIELGATDSTRLLHASFDQTAGVARYRAGDYPGAVALLTRSRDGLEPGQWHAADFYLAMVYHRLGRTEDARQALARGVVRNQATPIKSSGDAVGNDPSLAGVPVDAASWRVGPDIRGLSGALEDWLICQVARREAEATLGTRGGP